MQIQRLCLILTIGSVLAWSQNAVVPNAPEGATQQPLVPSNLTADMPQAAFARAGESPSALIGHFTVGAGYDDNAVFSSIHKTGDQRFLLAPGIQWVETRPRATWGLQYSPRVTIYQHSSLRDLDTQAFSGNMTFTPTERLRFHLRQDYVRTNDPFAQAESPLPSLGVLNSASPTVVTWGVDQVNYHSNAGVDYILSEHKSVGVDGTFSKYDNNMAPSSLLNSSQVATVSSHYSQQLSPRYSLGVQFAFTDMAFMASPAHSNSYSLLYSQTINFSSSSSLMLYGGVGFTRSHNVLPVSLGSLGTFVIRESDSRWDPVVGVVYGRSGVRNALHLEATHQVSSGGPVMRTAVNSAGSISFSRKLTASWTGFVNGNASDSNSVDLFNTYGRWRVITASAGISHDFTRHFRGEVRYDRIYQPSTANVRFTGNKNMVQLTMTYFFVKPLGS